MAERGGGAGGKMTKTSNSIDTFFLSNAIVENFVFLKFSF